MSIIEDSSFGTLKFSSTTKKWISTRFRDTEGVSVGFVAGDKDALMSLVELATPFWENREKLFERVRKRVLKEEFEDASESWEDEHESKLSKKTFLEILPNPKFITFSNADEEFFELSVECDDLFCDGYVVISGDKSGKIVDYVFY